MTLEELNQLPETSAMQWLMQTCASETWCRKMLDSRPYTAPEALFNAAKQHWQSCNHKDFLEAFEAHPMIGDVDSLREKFKNTQAMASHEQSGAHSASEQVLHDLHHYNQQYLQKHGFIFIIFATGKSAQEMLTALQQRIGNNTATEIDNAAAEQIKITLLRLNKNLNTPTLEDSAP